MSRRNLKYFQLVVLSIILGVVGCFLNPDQANAQVTVERDVTVTATVFGPPPTTQSIILQPTDQATVQTTPLVVQGTCGPGLLVRVFNNGDLAGSIACSPGGTFTMNITLIIGENELTTLNYDAQDQPGPSSPAVTVFVVPAPVDPDTPNPSGQPGSNNNDAGIIEDPAATESTPSEEPARATYTLLFSNSFLEPITKLLSFEILVSSTIKAVFDLVLAIIFLVFLITPFFWLLFVIWTRFF